MPICIECSSPVSHLYSTYSRADDRSLGKGVRLTQCPRCLRFADKYVEYDFVVIFIDLVLIKPQVYRHLLFNRLGGNDHQLDRSIVRLGILLLLFDVYLTWARIERSPSSATAFLLRAPIVLQYLFFLTLNSLATLAHHVTIRVLTSVLAPHPRPLPHPHSHNHNPPPPDAPAPTSIPSSPSPSASTSALLSPNTGAATTTATASDNNHNHNHNPSSHPPQPAPPPPPPLRRTSTAPVQTIRPLPPPSPASPAAISTALLVSSCAKLFPILLVIWGPNGNSAGNSHSSSSSNISNNYHPSVISSTTPWPATSHAAVSMSPDSLITTPAASPPPAGGALSSSTPLLESLVRFVPAGYLASALEVLGSLLSLEAADTHLVLLSNIEALYILLGCGYLRAMALAVAGLAARWTVQRVILGVVGVGSV